MDNKYRIACCTICTLSDELKRCKACPFNIGLPERERQRAALKPGLKPNHPIIELSGDSNPDMQKL